MKKSYCYWQSIDLNISGGRANYFFFLRSETSFLVVNHFEPRPLLSIFSHLKINITEPPIVILYLYIIIWKFQNTFGKPFDHFQDSDRGMGGGWRGQSIFCESKLSVRCAPMSQRPKPIFSWTCWDSSVAPPLAVIELRARAAVQSAQKMYSLEWWKVKASFKSQPYHTCMLLASLPKNRISLL